MKRHLRLLTVPLLVTALAACSAGAGEGAAPGTADPDPTGPADTEAVEPALDVASAFYPLELAVARIGGDRVAVTPLTQPGADPHDAELTPREVGQLSSVDLVVFLSEFQPAVDDAVGSVAGDRALDVSQYADLTLTASDDGHDHSGETDEEHAEHADEAEATDPHFWLDPTRMATVATAVGDDFATRDPANAATYRANASALVADLTTLDEDFTTGLKTCESKDLVTGHAAFGYLAGRYGLGQEGIAGISPDAEPDAATLRDLVAHVRDSGVSTVYAETLVSPALAETIARETGAKVAVLDPLEGLTDASAGSDYLEVMRANLQTLREGQGCT